MDLLFVLFRRKRWRPKSLRATPSSRRAAFGHCHVGWRRFRHLDKRDGKTSDPNQEWKPQCTGRVVFRVDKELGNHRTRLRISGEISSECIEVLETCCEQAIRDSKAVDLVLDVTAIDDSGRALLRRLAAKGVRMFARGIYHSHLVDTIRRAVNRDIESAR